MAEAVSAEEQRQIDEAIRVSKELWLAEAAEQRRRSLAVSPVTAAAPAGSCIDLCSSSEEEEEAIATVKAEPAKRPLERVSIGECYVVEPPMAKRPAVAAAAAALDGGDHDVMIEGQSGAMALIDFPHARENCVQHAFTPGNFAATCANCYCFVCDVPASACEQWATHARATHREAAWRKERERVKQKKLARLAAADGGMHTSAARAASAADAGAAPRGVAAASMPSRYPVGWTHPRQPGPAASAGVVTTPTTISCTELLRQVQQIWPVEEPTPARLKAQLRPYQRQSLAFMLELERAPAGASTVGRIERMHRSWMVRGGWLCDEVGMGKTMVCIATIIANPLPRAQQTPWTIDPATDWEESHVFDYGQSYSYIRPNDRLLRRFSGNALKLKTTLVLTKNTLIGQWRDELAKFAPHLRVLIYHAASGSSSVRNKVDRGKVDLSQVDVILNTTQTRFPSWFEEYVTFHRIIVDESHEGAAFTNSRLLVSSYRWAVTGTPCLKSLTDLGPQLEFVGHRSSETAHEIDECHRLQELGGGQRSRQAFARLIARLQRIMIRHTKAQRIAGDVALKLPDLEAETVWLTMNKTDKQRYVAARSSDSGHWRNIVHQGATVWQATMRMHCMMDFCSVADRKVQALLNDLRSLRKQEPHLHAVVFTQSVAAHKKICCCVREAGFTVYEISGSSNVKQRHSSIRLFQASEAIAKVFVLTMKTGNCGITLTAATRVYLMEPCIDPAHEQQAAGRIHRLGQHKDVLCKRFCTRDTYEEQVVELHARLKNGSASLTDGRLSGDLFQLITSK